MHMVNLVMHSHNSVMEVFYEGELSRMGAVETGGRRGTRTPDPLGVNEVL